MKLAGLQTLLSLLLIPCSLSFSIRKATAANNFLRHQLKLYSTPNPKTTNLQQKKRDALDAISVTNYGMTATESQKKLVDNLTLDLEALNPTADPARSPFVDGTWRLRYSTAPPPSNGSLGPLRGAVLQSIDLRAGVYANELLIGSNEANPWLSVTLIANWNDMGDGINWMVNFKSVTLTLFGRINLFTKKFDEGTARIWTTTFLDTDTRVVRAGVTESEGKRMGRSSDPQDYFLFFMTREPVARKVMGDIIKPPKVGILDVLKDPARFMDDDD